MPPFELLALASRFTAATAPPPIPTPPTGQNKMAFQGRKEDIQLKLEPQKRHLHPASSFSSLPSNPGFAPSHPEGHVAQIHGRRVATALAAGSRAAGMGVVERCEWARSLVVIAGAHSEISGYNGNCVRLPLSSWGPRTSGEIQKPWFLGPFAASKPFKLTTSATFSRERPACRLSTSFLAQNGRWVPIPTYATEPRIRFRSNLNAVFSLIAMTSTVRSF